MASIRDDISVITPGRYICRVAKQVLPSGLFGVLLPKSPYSYVIQNFSGLTSTYIKYANAIKPMINNAVYIISTS